MLAQDSRGKLCFFGLLCAIFHHRGNLQSVQFAIEVASWMNSRDLKNIYVHSVEVAPSDIDVLGHVNNVSYVSWMQAAAVAHSEYNGWSWERYKELGAGFVAREHHIEYQSSGFAGDTIYVETWVSGMKRVTSKRKYRFYREDPRELLAEAETKWAFVLLDSLSPTRIPLEILSSFKVVTRDQES